jgi:hypothetical protein
VRGVSTPARPDLARLLEARRLEPHRRCAAFARTGRVVLPSQRQLRRAAAVAADFLFEPRIHRVGLALAVVSTALVALPVGALVALLLFGGRS